MPLVGSGRSEVEEVALDDGSFRVGIVVAREELPDPVGGKLTHRLQLKVGNRELTRADFMWIDEDSIVGRSTPDDLVRVVRSEYGDAFGRIVDAIDAEGRSLEAAS